MVATVVVVAGIGAGAAGRVGDDVDVIILRSGYRAADSLPAVCGIARTFVAGKLHNTRWLLARSAREAVAETDTAGLRTVTEKLAYLLRELARAPDDPDIIRGLEGQAAALHFEVFPLHLRPAVRAAFPFDGRNRRPPRDAVNGLLSFLYALLRHDCVSALTAVGLDPFVGFLHTDRAGRESLALDLMEEFRPWAERLALTLLNRGELKPGDFVARDGGACELTDHARKSIVAAYQQRKAEELVHPLFREKVRHGQLPFIQARLLARALRDATPYSPHLFA